MITLFKINKLKMKKLQLIEITTEELKELINDVVKQEFDTLKTTSNPRSLMNI